MEFNNIVALCPREAITIEAPAFICEHDDTRLANPATEDAVEEMVVYLAGIETAWAAGEFKRLRSAVRNVEKLAEKTGLPDVAEVARVVAGLIDSKDDVALAAVVARLVRIGEVSLATLLEISYRQI